jgi:hypothetical protein
MTGHRKNINLVEHTGQEDIPQAHTSLQTQRGHMLVHEDSTEVCWRKSEASLCGTEGREICLWIPSTNLLLSVQSENSFLFLQ